jgi:hypothetical protein
MHGVDQDQEPGEPGRAAHPRRDVVKRGRTAWAEGNRGTHDTLIAEERAMKRNINGFEINWVGNDRIELKRDSSPKHRYEFETSPDQRQVKRLLLTSPENVTGGDPLLDAARYEEEARKAATEFLRQENRLR